MVIYCNESRTFIKPLNIGNRAVLDQMMGLIHFYYTQFYGEAVTPCSIRGCFSVLFSDHVKVLTEITKVRRGKPLPRRSCCMGNPDYGCSR